MEVQDRDFLAGMWAKAETKEENVKLAEKIIREKDMSAEFAENIKGSGNIEKTGHTVTAVFFLEMIRGIGIRQVYAGMADVLCIAFAGTGFLLYLLMRCVTGLGVSMDIAVFCGSPLLYGCIFLLFWIKDKQNAIYGLQMSFKYTFFHVLAVRMLAASLLGMCWNGLYVAVLILRYRVDGLRLLAISFSSLACFSVLLMAGMEKGRHFRWAAAVCVGWVAVNLTALYNFAGIYGELLGRIPVYLFLGAGAAGMLFYFRQLLFMTTLTFRKEYSDASN